MGMFNFRQTSVNIIVVTISWVFAHCIYQYMYLKIRKCLSVELDWRHYNDICYNQDLQGICSIYVLLCKEFSSRSYVAANAMKMPLVFQGMSSSTRCYLGHSIMNLNPFQIVSKSGFGRDSQNKKFCQFTFAFLNTPI